MTEEERAKRFKEILDRILKKNKELYKRLRKWPEKE